MNHLLFRSFSRPKLVFVCILAFFIVFFYWWSKKTDAFTDSIHLKKFFAENEFHWSKGAGEFQRNHFKLLQDAFRMGFHPFIVEYFEGWISVTLALLAREWYYVKGKSGHPFRVFMIEVRRVRVLAVSSTPVFEGWVGLLRLCIAQWFLAKSTLSPGVSR